MQSHTALEKCKYQTKLHFTNSLGMNDKELITGTTGVWGDGDVHFGFNISRVFTLSKPKEFRKGNKIE
jgi:hypothetical protein